MQDGAIPHAANATQNILREAALGSIAKDQWPSKSLDLNPCDYSLWGALKGSMVKRRDGITAIGDLKRVPHKVMDEDR